MLTLLRRILARLAAHFRCTPTLPPADGLWGDPGLYGDGGRWA